MRVKAIWDLMVLFQEDEFDYSQFWFDDVLTTKGYIPDHLRLEISKEESDEEEPFHSLRLYQKENIGGREKSSKTLKKRIVILLFVILFL